MLCTAVRKDSTPVYVVYNICVEPLISISTWFFWHDDKHGDDVVPVVWVDPSVVDDNTPAASPQIQWQGLLRLSSVKDIQYLQLSHLLPQVQTPDRPSGEPPAGHQLVWSMLRALEDFTCKNIKPRLSMDKRLLFGFIGNLWYQLQVFWPSLFYIVRFRTFHPCSTHCRRDMLYFEL
jgi:hypothetical protein